jgi:uncharacterized protein
LSAPDSNLPARTTRTLQLALFATSLTWFISSRIIAGRSANGITQRFNLEPGQQLLAALFLLFLLAVGFSLLNTIARQHDSLRGVLGLPDRPTARTEWLQGAALGWGMAILTVLPLVLSRSLYVTFWTAPRAFGLLLINLAAVAVGTLAEEVVFRGYPFRRLIDAIGPVGATLTMSLLFAVAHAVHTDSSWASILLTTLAGILLSVAWLRTHGLWLPWGIHFAWNASLGLLFGLPVRGDIGSATVVLSNAHGPLWLTGGDYGPEAALFTILALTIGIIVLVRITRDYAWNYTHAPIIPGGYPMEAKPPAAHVAMEQQAQEAANRPAALIQILPTTPQTRSVDDEPKP